jgi:hypothetical protein
MDVMHDAPADWEILVIGINESQPPKRAPRRRDESACALRRVGTGSQVPPKQHAFRRWMGVPNRRAREEPWKALKCYVVRNRSVGVGWSATLPSPHWEVFWTGSTPMSCAIQSTRSRWGTRGSEATVELKQVGVEAESKVMNNLLSARDVLLIV